MNELAIGRRSPAARAATGESDGGRLTAWFLADALPLWWRLGADLAGGGFYEALDDAGAPVPLPRRARVPPRQAVAFALGGRLGWPGPAREAARHAMTWFVENHRRPDGLYRASVEADGRPLDDRALLYDQAFALLGFFALHDLDPRPEHAAAAEELLAAIRRDFAHAAGGFAEKDEVPFQSNAQMHLFEACLAWASRVGGAYRQTADELGHLCLARLIDPNLGVIDEVYDETWRPTGVGGRGDRRIEPGHQFEWAWLLGQWDGAEKAERLAAARRLFAIGEASVTRSGAAPAAVGADGSLIDPVARLWPQTERLRTAAWLAREAGGDVPSDGGQWRAAASSAASVVERYLATPLPGLWRDKLRPDGTFTDEPAPASSFYHLAGAIASLEGIVLAGPAQGRPPTGVGA